MNGRSALLASLEAMIVPRDSVALLPSYLCESVITPFRVHGCDVRFYRIDERFGIDADHVADLVKSERPTVALAIHYFGFYGRGVETLRSICAENSIRVVEDCAHSLFGRHGSLFMGQEADAAIFSLRKSLPVPGGGLAVLPGASSPKSLEGAMDFSELGGLVREIGYAVEFRSRLGLRARLLRSDRVRAAAYDRNDELPVIAERPMGALTRVQLNRLHPGEIVARRRRNFRELTGRLRLPEGALPWDELPDGACPIGLPLLIADRDRVRRELLSRGVMPRTYWDVLPQELDAALFPISRDHSERILVLPVHENLTSHHLDVIAATVNPALARRSAA